MIKDAETLSNKHTYMQLTLALTPPSTHTKPSTFELAVLSLIQFVIYGSIDYRATYAYGIRNKRAPLIVLHRAVLK